MWNGLFLEFSAACDVRHYITARLSHSEPIEPPFDESRGIASEDVLISYYRRDTTDEEQKKWFWNAWKEVSQKAWECADLDTFRNAISLATELPTPTNSAELCNFLPNKSENYHDKKKYELFSQALSLLLNWNIVKKNEPFWSELFENYLKAMPDCKQTPPIINAYNGLGKLNQQHYALLEWYTSYTKPYPKNMVRSIIDDQKYICDHNSECENIILEAINNSMLQIQMSTKESRTIEKDAPFRDIIDGSLNKQNISKLQKMRPRENQKPAINPKLVLAEAYV